MRSSAKQGRITRSGSLERLRDAICAALPELRTGIKPIADEHRLTAMGLLGKRDATSFARHYLRCQVSKRYQQGSVTPRERRDNAIRSFLVAEAGCALGNVRLHDAFNKPIPENIRGWLIQARRLLHQVLGPFPWEQLPRLSAFSSGATTEFTKSRAFLQNKWDQGTHTTARCLPYCLAFVAWASSGDILPSPGSGWSKRFEIVDGNEVFTVVKNYEKDRLAAKEPTWNVFFQKGVGLAIKHRLQAHGLLHRDASDFHASRAQLASRLGHEATIDLSAASDSVSLALCELLCPDDWLQVFLDLRSPVGLLPTGQTIVYEKISSMGNGYTFELETALFYVLAVAVCGREAGVTVYGDDIIVPSDRAAQVIELLAFCGFETNTEKTFTSGFFRESCGGHFFDGHNVKPFYIETLPEHPAEAMELHNQLLAYSERCPLSKEWDLVLQECKKVVPRSFWGPYGFPGALWSAWDEACPTISRPRKGNRFDWQHPPSWRVKTFYKAVPSQEHDYMEGALFLALRRLERSPRVPPSLPMDRRRSFGGFARSWAMYQRAAERSAERDAAEVVFPRHAQWKVREKYVSLYSQWTPPPVRVKEVGEARLS